MPCAQERVAKAKAKADKESYDLGDDLVNKGATAAVLALGGFAAYTVATYASASSQARYFNLDDKGNEKGYSPDEPLFQSRAAAAAAKAKAKAKAKAAPKTTPAKAPAFEFPKFGLPAAPPAKAKASPKAKAKAKAKAKPEPPKPAFKFPWD